MESGEGVAVVIVGGVARDPPADSDVVSGGDDGMELILLNTTQPGSTIAGIIGSLCDRAIKLISGAFSFLISPCRASGIDIAIATAFVQAAAT